MGTPEFAVPSLDMLMKEGYNVVAVITQPDKPKGRGNKLATPPVKEYALSVGIPVLQPSKVKTLEFLNQLKELNPQLFITAAYGRILSKEVLEVPSIGCINVHGSLLPKLRGPAPIQWAIINGEKVTGITTMFTDIGMDTGDMLLKSKIFISEEMTVGDLHDKMAVLGANVLKDTLLKLKQGSLERVIQAEDEASYAPMLHKETGHINWSQVCENIHNLVRGTNPWPGAFSFYKGDRIRIWKCKVCDDEKSNQRPGTILKVGKSGIRVATSTRALLVTDIQFDSYRRMTVEEYLCGHNIDEGEILG